MEVKEYKKMYEFESKYWWYRGLRSFLSKSIVQLNVDPKNAKVLDAGCGTGGNLQMLKDLGYQNLFGVDFSRDAVRFCQERGFKNVIEGNVNKLPYDNHSFDLVLCSNVFESEEVIEETAFRELTRVLKPGGQLLIVVAAFQILLSEHDKAVHCIRRYNKTSAMRAFSQGSSKVELKYLFITIFPLLAGFRLLKKVFRSSEPKSDVGVGATLFTEPLHWLVQFEVWLSKFIRFPFGSSLLVHFQKSQGNHL